MKRSSRISLAIMATASVSLSLTTVPAAIATPAGDNVVISEVYGGGGSAGASIDNDFVELYNPTDKAISLEGWAVHYVGKSAEKTSSSVNLTGSIAPGGHYLIKGSGTGDGSDADAVKKGIQMGAGDGTIVLTNSTSVWNKGGAAVDFVSYGKTLVTEGAAASSPSATTSISRDANGTDTDNNAADFTVGAPTPQSSKGETPGGGTTDPEVPVDPETPVNPDGRISIDAIQGTGAVTPFKGKTVTTSGWVTASYPTGGLSGFTIQMGGPSETRKSGEASRAVFVYTGKGGTPAELGKCVVVTGTAEEFNDSTQLSNPKVTVSGDEQKDCGAGVEPNKGAVPTDPAEREANEHMLFKPETTYTVTNNYDLNTFGSVDLVEGDKPLMQATAVVAPGEAAKEYEAESLKKVVTLDDASTVNYFQNAEAKKTPLPYLTTAEGQKSLRTGDQVTFSNPVVLSYNFKKWGLQPTGEVTGKTEAAKLPISWQDSRPAEANGPQAVGGTHSMASFNVLNYFTDLGKDQPGCKSYKDMNGNPVGADNCQVRGAFTQEAFNDQQSKIVSAINKLDVSVLGLEEIENSSKFGHDRDDSLNKLVEALNAAGGNWTAVPSPKTIPADEDVIRTAFIYRAEQVEPVGESKILDDNAFNGIARQPLAQQFKGKGAKDEEAFVATVNHFKSKGSVARGDSDKGDGQGNNANLRAEMSRKLVEWLGSDADLKDKPQFILGDLNSYAKEDAVRVIEEGGFENVEDKYEAGLSYQFGGRLGSLDHVLANDKAQEMITGADVWDINSDESAAYEYSRRNYNATDFFAPDPFRSSDHDPIKVGFNLKGGSTEPTDPTNPTDPTDPTTEPKPPASSSDKPLGSFDLGKLNPKAAGLITFLIGLLGAGAGIGGALFWWFNTHR